MPELRVVEGKLSENYNHFLEYRFTSCEATDTRLMGVVALRVTWTGIDHPTDKMYQIIHLDYSEYGVDDYFEFECSPGKENYKENMDQQRYRWKSFTSVMGGKVHKIAPEVMMGLIDSAIPLADNSRHREYDNAENAEFRTKTLNRFGLMKTAIEQSGILKDKYSDEDIIRINSQSKLATCEVINYFLMRLIDHDYKAAAYLSTITEDELAKCPLTDQGIQTLIRNTIKPSKDPDDFVADGSAYPYRCRMTTLGETAYYYCTLVIYLDRDYRHKDARVCDIRVGSINKLSDYEAALQVQAREYITVFDCQDRLLRDFNGNVFPFLTDVEPEMVPNGWLYTVYNQDNSHVNKADYWLNDDVYGYALLSIDGEFVLMSHKLGNITYMDNAAATSLYSPFMELDGRYQIETPVFHNLCQTYGVMFRQFIEHYDND